MLCLIDCVRGALSGGKCRVRVESVEVLGLPAAMAVVETGTRTREKRLFRCLEGLAQTLRLMRAATVLFADGFPYREFFLDRGFREADCRELLRLKAAEILSAASSAHERVLLAAPRADRRAARLAGELGREFRYLVTCVPGDISPLEDACAGLGLTPEPVRRDGIADVDAAVFLDSPARAIFLPSRCRVLRFGEKSPLICGGREVERLRFRLPDRLRDSIPHGFPAPPLLSATLEAGRLPDGDVTVESAE